MKRPATTKGEIIEIINGAIFLCIPALMNGFPFFFNDSGDYLVLHPELFRSPFYGALLTVFHLNRFVWGPVFMQCLVASHLVWVLLRCELSISSRAIFLTTVAVLAAGSSLPYFTGFLMPDVFTSIMFVCMYLLTFRLDRLGKVERFYVVALGCIATAAHLSHWLIAVGALIPFIAIKAATGTRLADQRRTIGLLLLPIVGTLAGFVLFNVVIFNTWSLSAAGQTFLMANLIEHGPARAYLREACPTAGYKMCNVLDELPATADQFLWETGMLARLGGFTGMKAEAREIVHGTIWSRPGEVAAMIGRNFVNGLATHEMAAELAPSASVRSLPELCALKFGPEAREAYMASSEMRGVLRHDLLRIVDNIVLSVSLAIIALGASIAWRTRRPELVIFPACVLSFILADTFVCSALSGVHDRYQARVTWLLPLAAMMVLFRWPVIQRAAHE